MNNNIERMNYDYAQFYIQDNTVSIEKDGQKILLKSNLATFWNLVDGKRTLEEIIADANFTINEAIMIFKSLKKKGLIQ